MKTKEILAWHFLAADGRLANGDGREVMAGKTYTVKETPKLCDRGLHASVRALDALRYSPGPIVCRVAVSGRVKRGNDKLCGQRRRVLAMADATKALHLFAVREAARALKLAKSKDCHSWRALKTKLAWIRGKATKEELAAACAAARDAAWDAAWATAAAAWAAAAAASGAAWAAARDAAWDAASRRLERQLQRLF